MSIRTLHHDGLTFDVLDEGPRDGKPVVLLHGFPERSSTWRLVSPLLHQAGLRTIALDQRGYSPGARPRRRRDYRMHHLVGDVVALIDQVGEPVHLVGHDWGAAVGWAVTMRRPDQVVTRTMLLESVWEYHFDPQTNVIDVHISRLRAKIDKGYQAPLLHTVRGAGYMIRAH